MKAIITIIVIAAIGFAGFKLIQTSKQTVKDVPLVNPVSIQVKVVSASTADLEQTRPFLAKLTSKQVAAISSKMSGRIKEVLVKENQQVKKGDPLLRIDDAEILSAIKTQEEHLAAQNKDVKFAKDLHKRNQSLFKVGGLSREALDASDVSVTTKESLLEGVKQKIVELQIDLDYLNILAPFGGTIGTIVSREGNLATPGKPLLSINSVDRKFVFSYVPGKVAIEPGQEVFENGKKVGQVLNLYSDADNGLAVAEVSVEAPLIYPNNSYVTIDVVIFSGSGCSVPIDALIMTKEGAKLMVYKDGKFAPYSVNILADNQTNALVEPCPSAPMAIGSASKLSTLPGHAKVLINKDDTHGKK